MGWELELGVEVLDIVEPHSTLVMLYLGELSRNAKSSQNSLCSATDES
jgi:hypothetical protein